MTTALGLALGSDEPPANILSFQLHPSSTLQFARDPDLRTVDWRAPSQAATSQAEASAWIFLYGATQREPRWALEAGPRVEVPQGQWWWLAEAPGWVSAAAEPLHRQRSGAELAIGSPPPHTEVTSAGLSTGSAAAAPVADLPGGEGDAASTRQVDAPLVPACRHQLNDDRRWRAVQRLELWSLDHRSAYPWKPGDRAQIWAPTGPLAVLAVGSGDQPLGIGLVSDRCQRGAVRNLPFPELPARGSQHLWVPVRLPADLAHTAAQLSVRLVPGNVRGDLLGRGGLPPTASLVSGPWAGDQLFLDLATAVEEEAPNLQQADWTLVVQHPRTRSVQIPLQTLERGLQRLPEILLQPRLKARVSVEFRPLEGEPPAAMQLWRCHGWSCAEPVGEGKQLVSGTQELTFEGLDSGAYRLQGVVDGQTVWGPEAVTEFEVAAEATRDLQLEPLTLRETEAWGEIRIQGEPVNARLILKPYGSSARAHSVAPVSDHVYATGEDGFYNLRRFGDLAVGHAAFASRRAETVSSELVFLAELCTSNQLCTALDWDRLPEGRHDIEIQGRGVLELRIVDAQNGEALPGASVAVFDAVVEDAGNDTSPPRPVSALSWRGGGRVHLADEQGDVRILVDDGAAKEAPVRARIWAKEYAAKDLQLYFPEAGALQREVSLRRVARMPRPQLVLAGTGQPVGGAGYLLFDDQGRPDTSCSGRSGGDGRVGLPWRCLQGGRYLLLHPGARLQMVPAKDFGRSRPIALQPAASRPELRVHSPEGHPIAGLALALSGSGWKLGPMDLAELGLSPLVTSADGTVRLPDIDPALIPEGLGIHPANAGYGTVQRSTEEPAALIVH